MARPLKALARDTRRDILDRSLDLFAEHGFYGTSMRQIARAVGVRESALYHHFPSKNAILQALLGELGPGRTASALTVDVPAMAEALGVEAMLRQLLELVVTNWAAPQEQKFFRLMLSEALRLDADGVVHPPALMRRMRGLVAGIIETLVERRLIRRVDPAGAALALMGPVMLLRVMYLAMPSQQMDFKGLKAEVERHVAFFWEAVRPLEPAAGARRAARRTK